MQRGWWLAACCCCRVASCVLLVCALLGEAGAAVSLHSPCCHCHTPGPSTTADAGLVPCCCCLLVPGRSASCQARSRRRRGVSRRWMRQLLALRHWASPFGRVSGGRGRTCVAFGGSGGIGTCDAFCRCGCGWGWWWWWHVCFWAIAVWCGWAWGGGGWDLYTWTSECVCLVGQREQPCSTCRRSNASSQHQQGASLAAVLWHVTPGRLPWGMHMPWQGAAAHAHGSRSFFVNWQAGGAPLQDGRSTGGLYPDKLAALPVLPPHAPPPHTHTRRPHTHQHARRAARRSDWSCTQEQLDRFEAQTEGKTQPSHLTDPCMHPLCCLAC